MAENQRVFEGRLVKITEVNSVRSKDGKFMFPETVFTLEEHQGKPEPHIRENIRYRGIILQDSIGH